MSPTENNLVEMTGVKLQFSDKMILNGIDLSLKAHDVLVIMGMSGSGKSTLLSILLGLLKPDAGTVSFNNQNLMELSREKWNVVRTHIGMVYQTAALISSLSVRENIAGRAIFIL